MPPTLWRDLAFQSCDFDHTLYVLYVLLKKHIMELNYISTFSLTPCGQFASNIMAGKRSISSDNDSVRFVLERARTRLIWVL
jgi:hypothetical protein